MGMGIERVGPKVTPLVWHSEPIAATQAALAPTKEDIQKGQAQVAALNFKGFDTIESMATTSQEVPKTSEAIEAPTEKKSFLGRVGDWFWGMLGYKKETPDLATASSDKGVSKVQTSVVDNEKKLAQSIIDLNRELNKRIKETAEFEEEMLKAGSNKLDNLYFVHLVKFSLDHKASKESSSLLVNEDLMRLHEKNKNLHKVFYNLKEEIANREKSAKVVKWVNIGTTGAIVGFVALSFATGGIGGVFSFALPLLSLGKGGLTIAQGGLSYKNDLAVGELTMVSHQTKTNSGHIEDNMETMQLNDADIKSLYQHLRGLMDNHSEAVRLFAQFAK